VRFTATVTKKSFFFFFQKLAFLKPFFLIAIATVLRFAFVSRLLPFKNNQQSKID